MAAALPNGLGEIIAAYGNPLDSESPVRWERLYLRPMSTPPGLFTSIDKPVGLIRVHRDARARLTAAMIEMVRTGAVSIPLVRGYAWSVVGDRLSIHTWGIAFDFGAVSPEVDIKVSAAMTAHAFVETHPHHFQLATGYDVE